MNDVKHMCKFSVVRPIGGEGKRKTGAVLSASAES